MGYNPDLSTTSRLAESVEPNADGTQWRIRLRKGVTWHDGKPLVADDVLYSFARILDPELALDGAVDLAFLDLANSRRSDDLTVELALSQPIADLPSTLAGYTIYVVQDGATDFSAPVGTGPFVFQSFRPGEAAVYTRNERYWEDDLPYLDQLEVLTIVDVSTRENALLGGEVDLADQISPLQAKALTGNSDFGVLESPIGTMRGFVLKLDLPPFGDELVREALKYAVDRQAMVDSVYLGYGQVGNDLYGKGHPFYNDELPQREYDPERSRSLLRQAGMEGLEIPVYTSDATPGMLEAATLLVEQARDAGFSLTLDRVPADSYYTNRDTEPLSQTGWGSYSIEWFYGQTLLTDSPYNDTNWKSKDFDQRFAQMRGTLDEDKRRQLFFALQEEQWRRGGYLIYAVATWLEGFSSRIQGLVPAAVSSNDFASYRKAWLA